MSTKTPTDKNANGTEPATQPTGSDLTAFQRNILTVLADEPRYGLAIKRELEAYYGKEVNHGRLYPNLDTLVQKGFVEKSELDKRTNNYALTYDGCDAVEEDLAWRRARIETDDEEGDS